MILGKFKKYVENAQEIMNDPKSNKRKIMAWKMDAVIGLKDLSTLTDGSIPEKFVKNAYTTAGKFKGISLYS